MTLSAPRRFCAPSFLRPVVSAPRRFCAPSFLRLRTSLLASLLLATPAAHAGSFVGSFTDPYSNAPSQYSGGTHYTSTGLDAQNQATFSDVPDSLYTNSSTHQQAYGGGSSATRPNGTHADCSGTIKTSWTWVPAAGKTITTDPPPPSVVIMQTCTVSVTVEQPGGTGNYATGLGKNGQVTFNPPSNLTGSATDTKYTVETGATVTLPDISPQASVTNSPANASVSYTASIVNGNWAGPYYFHNGIYGNDINPDAPWAGNTAGTKPAITDTPDNIHRFTLTSTASDEALVEGSITPVWYWTGPDLGMAPPGFWINVTTNASCYDNSGSPTATQVLDGIENDARSVADGADSIGSETVPVKVESDEYAPCEGNGYWAIGPTIDLYSQLFGQPPFNLYAAVDLDASIESGL